MSAKRPHLVLTNDDGINAPGLYSLWRALVHYADITIVAPLMNQSGKGLSITTDRPLHITQKTWEQNTLAYQVDGTPTDCIKLALSVLLPAYPDMIVSGINLGSNSGRNVLYSGTVGGVIEGAMRDIPGIAFSCDNLDHPQFEYTEPFIYPFVRYLLENPLQDGSFLNVTFPNPGEPIHGVRLAQQGLGYWEEMPEERSHPSNNYRYFWLGGTWRGCEEHKESDVELLKQGYITAVPLRVHQLTDHVHWETHKTQFDAWFDNVIQKR